MTAEHLRPLWTRLPMQRSSAVCEGFARAQIPDEILQSIRMGRMTTLQKPTGGVRGIVVGDFVRRLVARTIAQQLGPAVSKLPHHISSHSQRKHVASVWPILSRIDSWSSVPQQEPIICSAAFLPMWLTWVIRSLLRCRVARQGGTWTPPQVPENASWTSVSKLPHGKICKEAPFPAARTGRRRTRG